MKHHSVDSIPQTNGNRTIIVASHAELEDAIWRILDNPPYLGTEPSGTERYGWATNRMAARDIAASLTKQFGRVLS